MKTKAHNCPYLDKYRKCTYKRHIGDCIYSNKEDCPLWQHSSTIAENLHRKAPRAVKIDSKKDVKY